MTETEKPAIYANKDIFPERRFLARLLCYFDIVQKENSQHLETIAACSMCSSRIKRFHPGDSIAQISFEHYYEKHRLWLLENILNGNVRITRKLEEIF